MKIKIILFVCVVIVAFVTYNLGLVAGIKKEQRNEFFYHKALLDNCSKSMGDQLREYTKARYYLFSRYVGDDVFLTESKDLGPVDSAVLKGVFIGVGDYSPQTEYEYFRTRKNGSKPVDES